MVMYCIAHNIDRLLHAAYSSQLAQARIIQIVLLFVMIFVRLNRETYCFLRVFVFEGLPFCVLDTVIIVKS